MKHFNNQHVAQLYKQEKSAFFTIYSVKMTLVPN